MNTFKTIVLASTTFAALASVSFTTLAEPASPAAANALTSEQHLALAQQFDAQAAAANDKAAAHEVMARTAAPKGNRQTMTRHCDKLIAQYRAEAGEYAGQAAAHRLAVK